jgi:predicted amidohydrolase YtcJ
MIILADDPLSVAPERLADIAPDIIIVNGKTVWERPP